MAVEQAVNQATNTAKSWGSYALSTFKTVAPLMTAFAFAGMWIGGPAALAGKAGADIGALDWTKLSWEGITEVGSGAWDIIKSGVATVAPHLNEMAGPSMKPA